MAACLASILELDLDDVPNFGDDRTPQVAAEAGPMGWWTALRRWLRAGPPGYGPLDIGATSDLAEVTWGDAPPEARYVVAGIPRLGGWAHSVVADALGFVVHDPYPGGSVAVGVHIDRLAATEVLVLLQPYEPFPDRFEETAAGG